MKLQLKTNFKTQRKQNYKNSNKKRFIQIYFTDFYVRVVTKFM